VCKFNPINAARWPRSLKCNPLHSRKENGFRRIKISYRNEILNHGKLVVKSHQFVIYALLASLVMGVRP
jgi:hypothetical protein